MRFGLLCLMLVPALSAAKVAHSAESEGPWLAAIQNDFVVLDTTTGDLDGDGNEETAVCYEDPRHPSNSGLAILQRDRGALKPVLHVVVELRCEKLKIANGRLGIKQPSGARGPAKVVWKYGSEIVFADHEKHPLAGLKASASSDLGSTAAPKGALDANLATSWAEGSDGTGIGETLTVKLPGKTHVAYIGIFGGHGGGERAFYDHNRVHRASLKTQTDADLGDAETGIDFGDLGLELGGDRLEFSVKNKPAYRYIRVDKRDVLQLELRIESVYLGRRQDDTHVAELEIVPLLSRDQLVRQANVAKTTRRADGPVEKRKRVKKKKRDVMGKRGKAVLDSLDADGRSIVSDDF